MSDRMVAKSAMRVLAFSIGVLMFDKVNAVPFILKMENLVFGGNKELRQEYRDIMKEVIEEMKAEQAGLASNVNNPRPLKSNLTDNWDRAAYSTEDWD